MPDFTFQLTVDTVDKLNSNQNTISSSPVQTFHWSLQILLKSKFHIWISHYLEELFLLVVANPLHLFKV